MKIKKGDSVIILSGSQKGENGKVTATQPAKGTVIVSGINVRTRHEKPSTKNNNRGGIIKEEMPINVSKVGLARPGSTKKATRVGYEVKDKSGKIRVARQASNKEIK